MGIQELISIMGYRKDSPFKNNPYNDIYTENGTIDMSNTDQDLWGIDEFGTKKRMKAGRKNPYKFEGQVVREIPIGQKGGFTKQDIYDYLFEDDEEVDTEVQAQQEIQQVDNKPDLHQETTIKNMVFEKRIADSRESSTPKILGNKGQYAFNYLQQKHGLPAHVAAGIVGNFIQESGNFRDDVISGQKTGDSGRARGIAQWHPDRWNPLLNSAKEQGRNPYTLDFQLDYAIQEAKQRGDLNKVMNTKTSEEAANTFAKWYERPKVIDKNRARYAQKYHPYKYGGIYEEILNII